MQLREWGNGQKANEDTLINVTTIGDWLSVLLGPSVGARRRCLRIVFPADGKV